MTVLARLRLWLRGVFARGTVEREMSAEMRFHLEMEIEAHRRAGMSERDARRAALVSFGGIERFKSEVRGERGTRWLIGIDSLRHAFRRLRARPALTLLAIAMLGVGIGLTTAMASIVDSMFVRRVPFAEADRLAMLWLRRGNSGRPALATPVYRAMKTVPAFERVEGYTAATSTIETPSGLADAPSAFVSPGLFSMLGVRPVAGRLFAPEDGRAGTDDRVILGARIARRIAGGSGSVVGRRIRIDGQGMTVVGVLSDNVHFPRSGFTVWRALDYLSPSPALATKRPTAVVRYALGIPPEPALAAATTAAHEADATTATSRIDGNAVVTGHLDPFYREAAPVLGAAIVLVFLVLCANVASLLLAQLTARRREYGMCSALGASRARLLGEALLEGAILAAAGVAIGILLASQLASIARALLPAQVLAQTLNPINIDPRALVAAGAAGILATLLSGLLPAWLGTRVDPAASIKSERGTETRGARLVMRGLLVAEIGLACALLAGATLLVRSFISISTADRGLVAENVLTISVGIPGNIFTDPTSRTVIARAVDERVRHMPGVERTAMSFGVPPEGGSVHFGDAWQSDLPGSTAFEMMAYSYEVGPDFFALYGLPLLRGRTFNTSDGAQNVIVSELFAKRMWNDQDPVGRSFIFDGETFYVHGVVRESHLPSIDTNKDLPQFYRAFQPGRELVMLSMKCAVACPPIKDVQDRIRAVSSSVNVGKSGPLVDEYIAQFARPRAAAILGGIFAIIAVVAAAGGLFSVLTFTVNRRRRELGIRSALGASPGQIRRMVLRDGAVTAMAGVFVGAGAAWMLARALARLSYQSTPADPMLWAIVLVVVGVTALAASWRPARRAALVDPVALIREE